MHHSRAFLATTALALAALLTPTAASATTPDTAPMQERVEDVIEKHGGMQTGWNEVTWVEGAVVLTMATEESIEPGLNSARTARDNCAAGR